MRNVQRTASCGAECARSCGGRTKRASERKGLAGAVATLTASVATICCAGAAFANGCEAGPVRCCEVRQQAIFAQQPCAHGFGPGVPVTRHGETGSRAAAEKSATTISNAGQSLLCIQLTPSTACGKSTLPRSMLATKRKWLDRSVRGQGAAVICRLELNCRVFDFEPVVQFLAARFQHG